MSSTMTKLVATALTAVALTGAYQYARLQPWWPDFSPAPTFNKAANKTDPACKNNVCRAIVDGIDRPDPEPDHSVHPSPDAFIG